MKADWDVLLAQFIDARRHDPFAWGSRDCVALANDWVEILTDRRAFDAEHKTQSEADATIAKLGGLESAVTGALGQPVTDWRHCSRGDVVLFESDRGPALGVCLGSEFAAQSTRGLISFPITAVKLVWKVHA